VSGDVTRRIVLVTSNGWGLGHLSREIAIALAIEDRAEVTMFSFSRGLPLAARFGIKGEYCAGPDSPWIPPQRWNKYVERRFELFLDEVLPEVVLFDGVAPYLGVINALRRRPAISAGWLRRGMWRVGPTDGQLAKSTAFDFIIEPGDIAAEADTGPTSNLPAMRVPPVSLLEVVPALDRTEAATALGLDPKRPALLLGLGLGLPGDPVDARRAVIERALQHSQWQVGFIRSPLAVRSSDPYEDRAERDTNLVPIDGVYPLIRYLAAFDAAINAAGYNSVHELIPARVPTLFIPKLASRTDDQTTRAAFLERRGLALIAPQHDLAAIERQVDNLLGDARSGLIERLDELPEEQLAGGAAAVADILIADPPVGIRETGTAEWRQPGLKGMVKRVISPSGVRLVQQILGRTPPSPPRDTENLDTARGSDDLLVSDDLESVSLSSRRPVEHVLQGASSAYRDARHGLNQEFYDLR
jgi:hypothetical protein